MKLLFYACIFPGFAFSSAMGMLASAIDRKVTARVQYRQGPPLAQPLYDIVKLFGKELILPKNSSAAFFLAAPVIGLVGIVAVASVLGRAVLAPEQTFIGDLLVVVYGLLVPSLAIILGGSASVNPLASLGASREIKLVLAYELPFILALLVPIIQAGGSIRLGTLISAQQGGIVLASWSGALAFIAALLCAQAKLGLVPFDMAEAETEIMGGAILEYSGPALALYKLTKLNALFVLPLFLVVLFMGSVVMTPLGILAGAGKYLFVLVLLTLIRNTNPRVRIDQALRFFWGPVTIVAAGAVLLAIAGL